MRLAAAQRETGRADLDQQRIGAQRPDRDYPYGFAINESQIAQTLRNRIHRVRIVHAIDDSGSTFGQVRQTHGRFSNKNCSHCNP